MRRPSHQATRRVARLVGGAAGLVAAAGLLAGCGSGGSAATTSRTRPTNAVTAGTKAPLPAGRYPSHIAVMVCSSKAQKEIAEALGETASVPRPTWVDHLYRCHYDYADGSFALSVKELSSWAQTYAYFREQRKALGDTGSIGNLGQGAFVTRDGGIVVRKDWKVLYVDISGLPARFGKPATTRAEVAVTISDLILGCWAGD